MIAHGEGMPSGGSPEDRTTFMREPNPHIGDELPEPVGFWQDLKSYHSASTDADQPLIRFDAYSGNMLRRCRWPRQLATSVS